jgi:hypothetical protein
VGFGSEVWPYFFYSITQRIKSVRVIVGVILLFFNKIKNTPLIFRIYGTILTVKSKNLFYNTFLLKIKFLESRNREVCTIWIFIFDIGEAQIYSARHMSYWV